MYLVFNFTSYFLQTLFFLFRQWQLRGYWVTFSNECSLFFFRQYQYSRRWDLQTNARIRMHAVYSSTVLMTTFVAAEQVLI